ncbi:hexokinase family protein [Colletotrichum karsti]|uniref:Phosphotransferase n=1 Tax=Colletotrichum karsti TaxID=1095194 RepID=A0A9P6HZW8_9PEZI|nr:hexokinase family protein [Colletotrichum karsti]KAF9872276.1 hexokinase family protein [Colletotrichum karsti]
MDPGSALQDFLQPLHVDVQKIHTLSRLFYSNFKDLALNAHDQFLPTPISESILRPVSQHGHGSGGTNLRVGFVELLGAEATHLTTNGNSPPTLRVKEKAWPIDNALKAESSASPQQLFDWIGNRIATVVREALQEWPSLADDSSVPLPLGLTFSFPMTQNSISDATVMTMGKGFSIKGDAELGPLILRGYDKARETEETNGDGATTKLPPIRIAAISNDAVSTLISYIYLSPPTSKASMGLIVGTGCNATIPLKLSLLGPAKQPSNVSLLPGESARDVRIAVNTEWSIRGTAPPLRELDLITPWDAALDAALLGPGEITGFQPLEYMTAGRYLGELGRLMLVAYLESTGVDENTLPPKLRASYGLTTTFLSHFKPADGSTMLSKLEAEFPPDPSSPFRWTEETAQALYEMAKVIELRAAGIVAAATVALLRLAEDIPERDSLADGGGEARELGVGYTGGCISHFQNYLADTQMFLAEIVKLEFDGRPPVKVVLSPCHDGGIKGAGILAAAAGVSEKQEV